MTANNKKTIILFYPPYTIYLPEIAQSLATYREINFEIVETFGPEDIYDTLTIEKLIKLIGNQASPPTLIIDYKTYQSLSHRIFTWSVLGTLLTAGLISSIYVYRGEDVKKLAILKKGDADFLSFNSFYFQKALASLAFFKSLIN